MPAPRILIVGEDAIICHLLGNLLGNKGYELAGSVRTGEEAVTKSAEVNPDLIIMDVRLAGGMNGVEASHYIFELFHYPILFVTACGDEKLIDSIKYSQPYGIIFRPFTPAKITSNIALALFHHSTVRKMIPAEYPIGDPGQIMGLSTALILTDMRGRIIFVNPAAVKYIDVPLGKILFRHWRDVMMFINGSTSKQIQDPFAESARDRISVSYGDTAMVTTTSKRRGVRINVRPVLDSLGQALATLMVVQDSGAKPLAV